MKKANVKQLVGRSKALKAFRVFHRLTQKQLGNKLDLPKSYISDIETGKKNVSIKIIDRYAEIFDIPSSEILYLAEIYDTRKHRGRIANKLLSIIDWITSEETDSSVKLDLSTDEGRRFNDNEFGVLDENQDRRVTRQGRRSTDQFVT